MNELQVLKRINHQHCVELVASYTDSKYFGLLISPVADYNLSAFYGVVAGNKENEKSLRSFFGCLAHSLHFLHQNKIRHRDIKPENILVKGSAVYLADFGISLDWENLSRSTTTEDSGKSWTYCAPEVANYEKRNSSSDIWSLGCVFLEMLTVLKGFTVHDLREVFRKHSGRPRFY
ncbi:kinase-like protein, partial [Lophium mytilinum]